MEIPTPLSGEECSFISICFKCKGRKKRRGRREEKGRRRERGIGYCHTLVRVNAE